MMSKLQTAMLCMTASLSLGLTACGGGDKETSAKDAASATADKTEAVKSAPVAAANLSDGPDICFRAITKHLGADTKVSEITSFFSTGSAIDSSDSEPQGQMTTCTVQYQSPDDPRKLVGTRMDVDTGQFAPPSPVEITVMGNAADFRLDDHLIPLSNVNAAALTVVMDAQKARLGGTYSSYAWSGVRLMSPGAFSDKHTLRLDVTGRLAANDIKESGYASISTDGKAITADHLMP
jgi:hypothetical protein